MFLGKCRSLPAVWLPRVCVRGVAGVQQVRLESLPVQHNCVPALWVRPVSLWRALLAVRLQPLSLPGGGGVPPLWWPHAVQL